MIEDAHDSNVWSLAWHPLGHILCSGSNDHTTRFWSRARPGDEGEGEADEKARDRFKNAARGTDWDSEFIVLLRPATVDMCPNCFLILPYPQSRR